MFAFVPVGRETRCPTCRVMWHVHRDMGGFRLRCSCGGWVPVPSAGAVQLAAPAKAALLTTPGGGGAATVQVGGPVTRHLERVPTGEVVEAGALRHADVRSKRAWTNRSLLELIALFAALVGPATFVHLRYTGDAAAAAMPLASLASGILVLAVCATMGAYAFAGLRDAKPLQFLEAVFVAGGCAGLALGWGEWLTGVYPDAVDPITELRHTIGLPWTLFVVGMCPAIFEELAFRGLLQGRLKALLGHTTGILVTAAAFGLAHGLTFGLPFQLGLGVYLGYLRERTGSLYPGMVTHLVYNSTLVVLAT